MTDETTAGNSIEEIEPETVALHEADIPSIDAALETALAVEAEVMNEAPEGEPEAPPAQAIPQGAETDGQSVASTETAPATPEQRVYTQEEIQGIIAENERQKKQIDQKELFIQQRSTELGTLRQQLSVEKQQLAALRAQLVNGLEDRFSENPLQASNDRDTIKQIDSRLAGLGQQEARASSIVESQTFFLRHVNTEKVGLDDLAETLRADGVDDRYIAQFKANPWEWTTPEALVQLGKRAEERKEYIQADQDRRILAQHVMHLNAQAEKLKAKPRQVMSRVQQSLNQPRQMTAAGASVSNASITLDPTRMSNAELNAALKEAM